MKPNNQSARRNRGEIQYSLLTCLEHRDASYRGGLRFKPAGRECYLALPKNAAVHQSDTPDDFISKLTDFMTKARGWLRAGYP